MWMDSCSGHLYFQSPNTHWPGDSVGHRASLNMVLVNIRMPRTLRNKDIGGHHITKLACCQQIDSQFNILT
jgi:hypothetical protein